MYRHIPQVTNGMYKNYIIYYSFVMCHRIVVSAPAGSAPQSVLQRTGVIYTCPITPGECTGLVGNTSNPNDNRLFDTEG